MTVTNQELPHGRGSKKHFGMKMMFQFTIWRKLASAGKIFNKSVIRVIVKDELNQLTGTCHCKKVSQSQQYSASTLKKCGCPSRFRKRTYWERNNAKKRLENVTYKERLKEPASVLPTN